MILKLHRYCFYSGDNTIYLVLSCTKMLNKWYFSWKYSIKHKQNIFIKKNHQSYRADMFLIFQRCQFPKGYNRKIILAKYLLYKYQNSLLRIKPSLWRDKAIHVFWVTPSGQLKYNDTHLREMGYLFIIIRKKMYEENFHYSRKGVKVNESKV